MRLKGITGTFLGLALILDSLAPTNAQEAKPAQRANALAGPLGNKAISEAVNRLAGQLKQHPVRPSKAKEGRVLHMLDVESGEATLIADEPDEGLVYCGSPEWSQDGTRILYDTTPAPGNVFNLTRLKSIERGEEELEVNDLGPGNCPGLTREGDRIVFLLNPGAVAGATAGIWIMQANGERRRPLCEYGRPKLSPDGNHLMIVSFSDPTELAIIDIKTERLRRLTLPERHIFTTPGWAGNDTLVAAIGDTAADSIALLDISDPEQAKIKEVLWKKSAALNVIPAYPIYSPQTGRYIFIGRSRPDDPAGSLYSFQAGQRERPRRYKPTGFGVALSDPNFSPDGRYILFSCEKIPPPQK